jgi:hypothetical protein
LSRIPEIFVSLDPASVQCKHSEQDNHSVRTGKNANFLALLEAYQACGTSHKIALDEPDDRKRGPQSTASRNLKSQTGDAGLGIAHSKRENHNRNDPVHPELKN